MATCAICLCECDKDDQDTCIVLECNHPFHCRCIAQAFRFKPECPICRHVPDNCKRSEPEEDSDSDSESEEEEESLTIDEKISIAKVMVETSSHLVKRKLSSAFDTLTSLITENKKAKATFDSYNSVIESGYNDIAAETDRYHNRMISSFKRRNRVHMKEAKSAEERYMSSCDALHKQRLLIAAIVPTN
jgi:hypothetical protein